MLKIGLVGSAYLIEKHIDSIVRSINFQLVGFYNTNVNSGTKLPTSIVNQ